MKLRSITLISPLMLMAVFFWKDFLACMCFIYVGPTRWHSSDHWKSTATH
jgi:hypothetical protein